MKIEKESELREFERIQSTILIYLVCILLFAMLISKIGTTDVYEIILYMIIAFVFIFTVLFAFSSMILTSIFKNNKLLYFNYLQIKILNKVKYYIMIALADLLKLNKRDIRRFFIKVNNIAVIEKCLSVQAKDILILVPHCLQNSLCEIKLTEKVELCKRCGKCDMSKLVDLKNRYGVSISVANGGTSARRKIVIDKPKFVIAVACERDLIEGIIDTGLRVYGVLNETPSGPCVNTLVDISKVELILSEIIKKG